MSGKRGRKEHVTGKKEGSRKGKQEIGSRISG
jgi:hypothetical protein